MKITTFNPLIVTAHSDDIISLFRDLGFEVRHEKKELDSVSSKLVRMRDANGNHVDIVQQDQMPRDLTSIRMNVNSFQEAYDLLTAHGFKSNRTDGTISQDKTAKGIGMVSPSGFMIAVAEHIKKGARSMKITTFNPQIITKDAEPIVKLFEELGFEKRHNPEGIGDLNVEGIRMKDANGFYLDISTPEIDLPQDVTVIRMNVDNFDEAFELLTARGFKNFYGDKTVEMKSSRSALMISESGFAINLVQHIKR